MIAAGAVAVATRRSAGELRTTGAPLAGLTAVFVFAAQMINFPVGAGTSGHLLGGTLAAVLVGPWTAVLAMTVVLGVQALFFADGGLTALGTNVLLMGVVPVVVGYGIARALAAMAPGRQCMASGYQAVETGRLRHRGFVAAAAGVGALISVPASALTFALLYAVGGTIPLSMSALVAAMVGWHVVIGIGEALITSAVVSAVLATRPDLVQLNRERTVHTPLLGADNTPHADQTPAQNQPAPPSRRWYAGALLVTALIAGGLSIFASSHPDGLEYVGESLGFGDAARDSATVGSPLSDYGVAGIADAWATGLAGVIGLTLVAVTAYAVMAMVARAKQPPQRVPDSAVR